MRRLALLAAIALTGVGCGANDSAESVVPKPKPKPKSQLELRSNRHGGVYMGVRCREPNSVRCDRVGLAIWLKEPAETLVARIEGRRLELVSPGEFVPGEGTGWEGYLKPAGLLDLDSPLAVAREPGQPADYWSGRKPIEAKVRLKAGYSDGSTATKTLRVSLRPGWG